MVLWDIWDGGDGEAKTELWKKVGSTRLWKDCGQWRTIADPAWQPHWEVLGACWGILEQTHSHQGNDQQR